jgi:hypothetical protein
MSSLCPCAGFACGAGFVNGDATDQADDESEVAMRSSRGWKGGGDVPPCCAASAFNILGDSERSVQTTYRVDQVEENRYGEEQRVELIVHEDCTG